MFKKLVFAFVAFCLCGSALASRLIYKAEQNWSGLPELFIVDLNSPNTSLAVSRPYSAPTASNTFFGGVSTFAISPDGRDIVYIADQDGPQVFRPYIVDITNPAASTQIGNLPASYSGGFARFSPDGNFVAMTAHPGTFKQQLYVVDLTNPGTATLMNGALSANGAGVSLTGFEITPDSRHLVYAAAELDRFMELYAVDLAMPMQSVRLNAQGGNVGDTYEGRFHVHPDGNRVVYSQVWQNPGVREVHVVAIDNPGMPVTLNAPFQPDGYVANFFVSPDGQYVAYTADQVTDGFNEAFLVNIDNPGVATNLSSSFQAAARVVGFTADSRYVLFRGPDSDLFLMPVDLSAGPVLLAAPLGANESMGFIRTSPDGDQVAYYLARDGGAATDVMVASISAPGVSNKINGPLPDGGLQFGGPLFSPDGSEVVFDATVSQTNFKIELFFSKVDAPGTSMRLNDPAMAGYVASNKPGDYAFLPANAPPTGQPGGSNPPPASPVAQSGGGGAMTWLILLLGLVVVTGRAGALRS